MKNHRFLCTALVALAALALPVEGAFAQGSASVNNTSKSNVKQNGMATAPNRPGQCQINGVWGPCRPPVQGQSTTVNSSRSNIKNN